MRVKNTENLFNERITENTIIKICEKVDQVFLSPVTSNKSESLQIKETTHFYEY